MTHKHDSVVERSVLNWATSFEQKYRKIELTRVKLALRIFSPGKFSEMSHIHILGYLLICFYLGGFLISHHGVFSRSHSSSTCITLTGVEFISTKSTFVISYFKLSYPPSLSGLNWSFFCSGVLWKKNFNLRVPSPARLLEILGFFESFTFWRQYWG